MSIELSAGQKRMYCCYIDLLASVLNGTKPTVVPNFDWNFFCKHAQRNAVLNLLGYAISKLDKKPDVMVAKVAENERRCSIIKETSQLMLVEQVLNEFEKAGIVNMPLKGYFIKNLYPQSDFRTMTDLDILVHKKDFKKIEEIFKNLGFSQEFIIKSEEIHFRKDLTYFEIQATLNHDNESYFNDVWSKAKLREDYNFSHELTNEDFYIYMIYHCARHFKSGGIGIRMLMDIYIFLSTYKNLNAEYLKNAFKELEITEFERELRKTAMNWFSTDKTVISPLGELILYCSTFGQLNIFFYQDSRKTKGNYWLKQFFIPYSTMKSRYAYVKKFPFLLPFSWAQYWFTRLFVERNVKVKKGFRERIETVSEDDKIFLNNLLNDLNL